ncbi:MAG: non-heme iron oxygenase ferredoxin subunit [Alicyclobacillus sp.]|nr:non-heme iron oxygenase ferredoxin subunit [Alicyclobacillus sp.]
MAWITVGPAEEISQGDMKCFWVDNVAVTVYHLNDGWYATSDTCTHQECSLSEGELEDDEIVCPCHGGAFDIRTGVATRMPCVIPVETFAVRIRDGRIEVNVE